MQIASESVLREEIIEGDHLAFKRFYDLWDERVYFFFLKKTNDEKTAQDLTQQTFVKFWRYRLAITETYSLEVQLFQKAKLIFIDWLRKEASDRKRLTAAALFYDNQHLDAALPDSRSDELEEALCKLPPMRRKVIELSHLQGYKYKEISEKLKISVKTVDNHIYQALKQLRKYLSVLLSFLW